MQIQAAFHDDKAKARAWNLTHIAATMKSLEEAMHVILRNANAMVNDLEDGIIPLTPAGEEHLATFRQRFPKVEVLPISAEGGDGMENLKQMLDNEVGHKLAD